MMSTQDKAKHPIHQKSASIALVKLGKRSGQQSLPTAEGKSASSQSGERVGAKNLPATVEEFDRRFDEGEDLESLGVDLSKATQPGLEIKRINIDIPANFVDRLDHWAAVRGMTRQALIKSWLYDRLEQESK